MKQNKNMNMGTFGFRILLSSLLSFYACSNDSITNSGIDNFISQYDSVKFNGIKGMSIVQRNGTPTDAIYAVGQYGTNRPPYFVTFNIATQSITKVDKNLLQKDSVLDYLTENEIHNAVNTVRKYGFYLLSVDSLENVFINPFYSDEPAYFLRLNISTGDSIVRKGYVYELYKEKWYLNKTRRKN